MKARFIALLAAALLLTGCNASVEPAEPVEPDTSDISDITEPSDVSQPTESEEATTQTTSSATTESTKPIEEPQPDETDSAASLYNKDLFYNNEVLGSFGKNNPIISLANRQIITEPYQYHPYTSYGLMSESNDDAFTSQLDDEYDYINNESWWDSESFGDYTVTYNVKDTDDRHINVEEYTMSLKGNKLYVRNAFIRKTNGDKYEFIIDPLFMDGIPLLSNNADFMRFEVNGREFYSDTLSVTGCKMAVTGELFDTYGVGEDYIYARVSFKDLDIVFNSERGYSNTAEVVKIEFITEDTEAVIDGSYSRHDTAQSSVIQAAEQLAENHVAEGKFTRGINFIDLDHNGTPELINSYFNEYDGMGDYYINDIYSLESGTPKLIDTMRFDSLYEAEYNGKQGWICEYQHYDNFSEERSYTYYEGGAMFFTLENGEISKHIFGYRNIHSDDDNYDEAYFIGNSPAEFIETKITRQFDNIEVSEFSCNGITGSYEYEVFDMALRAEYTEYITASEPAIICYEGWCGGDEQDYTNALRVRLNKFFFEPTEELYREESKGYFEGGKAKPVIYLYPETPTDVTVKVDFPYGGEFTCTYPDYRNGWSVTAQPDGTLTDANGDEYYCLYWEGDGGPSYDMSEGFCVSGRDTASFLREKLMYMGLTAREANEFIIYWLPLMEDNPYNIISFHTDAYNETAPLTVSPEPDSVIRVFMTWYASDTYCEIPAQELTVNDRTGFTVVEWGGTQYGTID